MGGSDPTVIGELQESNENPFPKRNFNEDSKDPLEQLKNQVSSTPSCSQGSVHAYIWMLRADIAMRVVPAM